MQCIIRFVRLISQFKSKVMGTNQVCKNAWMVFCITIVFLSILTHHVMFVDLASWLLKGKTPLTLTFVLFLYGEADELNVYRTECVVYEA